MQKPRIVAKGDGALALDPPLGGKRWRALCDCGHPMQARGRDEILAQAPEHLTWCSVSQGWLPPHSVTGIVE